jgi:TetR/AcrR family transcriptional regulator, fatty acid biosynthesis regulator
MRCLGFDIMAAPHRKRKVNSRKRVRLAPSERQSLILDHTAEIIAREGILALSMDRIGREAGISKSLVYNYFPNMTDLLRQLLQREWRHLRRLQAEAAENADTFEGLVRSVTHAHLKYIDERGMLIERLQAEPSVSAADDPAEFSRDKAFGYLADIVTEHFGLPPELAKAATDISFGLPAAAGAYLQQRALSREQLEELTVTMIMGTLNELRRGQTARLQPIHRRPAAPT